MAQTLAPITTVLSQYELLQAVCKNLSSADIIDLAATCKEHRTYITSSKATLANLMSAARCDGRGIVAQARVFGYWNGDSSQATMSCLDADTKPCSSCGAQNCRFHFSYQHTHRRNSEAESDFTELVKDRGRVYYWFHKLPDYNIESAKAYDLFHYYRRREYCDTCEPLVQHFESKSHCKCDFFDHFVGKRWLCLPCFFLEEAEAYQSRRRKVVAHDGDKVGGPTRRMDSDGYVRIAICQCGQPAREDSNSGCTWCNKPWGFFPHRAEELRRKIYAQLG